MENLCTLLQLLDCHRANVLGLQEDLTQSFYRAIQDGKADSDETGMALFYPDRLRAKDQFTRLKNGLWERAINTLLTTEELHDGYWKKYYNTYKKMVAGDMLWKKGMATPAVQLVEAVCKIAVKYHFTKLAVMSSRELTYHFATMNPQPKYYRKYKKILKLSCEKDYWEDKARDYYYEICLELRRSKTVGPHLVDKLAKYKAELDNAWENIRTVDFQYMRNNVDMVYFQIINDTAAMTETCRKSLAYFEGLPFTVPGRAMRTLYFYLIPAYLQAGQYVETRSVIHSAKELVNNGSLNWTNIHLLEAILGFHTGDFQLVKQSLNIVKQSKKSNYIKEEIRIYQIYVNLMEDVEEYKLGRFLNEVPHFAADKKGMNINIIILQILILLKRNDRPKIIDRMEALQAYAYRYLARDQTTRRSELFFRMLFLLAKSAFEVAEVERRSPGITEELHNTPRHISAIDIEIVPYELLWNKVVEWSK